MTELNRDNYPLMPSVGYYDAQVWLRFKTGIIFEGKSIDDILNEILAEAGNGWAPEKSEAEAVANFLRTFVEQLATE